MLNRRFTLPIAAFAAAAFAFASTPAGALSDKDRPEIEAIIKDYLIKNPEVLGEALEALQQKQEAQAAAAHAPTIAANKKVIFDSPRAATYGNPNGDVTLVEFFDYNCGYCKHAVNDVAKLVSEDPKLKVVFKELPVLAKSSETAARIAIAVRMQDKGNKYFEFHRRLLANKGEATKERALAAAKEAGFDIARIQKDMDSEEVNKSLAEAKAIADGLGIQGTPTFIIGDELIVGAQGYDKLKSKIASVRKCGKATC